MSAIDELLQPLQLHEDTLHRLALRLWKTFAALAAHSQDQFLTTPIPESALKLKTKTSDRPSYAFIKASYSRRQGTRFASSLNALPYQVLITTADASLLTCGSTWTCHVRWLRWHSGGTNLRVGFVRLSYQDSASHGPSPLAKKQLEESWPIEEHFKSNEGSVFFAWIGQCIAKVVFDACSKWHGEVPDPIPMGITFSFAMSQTTLNQATLLTMGKGFTMPASRDLGSHVLKGYEAARHTFPIGLPSLDVKAIVNDSVATLVCFYWHESQQPRARAAMSIIVGTGTNATILMPSSKLSKEKQHAVSAVLEKGPPMSTPRIAVNTEWSIRGSALPLHELGLVSQWDSMLDRAGSAPGFQPFEYMTSGRYLGELGRLIFLHYVTRHCNDKEKDLPVGLRTPYGLQSTLLGKIRPSTAVELLQAQLPSAPNSAFAWADGHAAALYEIARAIERRAAGMIAAATVALLLCGDELELPQNPRVLIPKAELRVGYTGGCIDNFQDYARHCQESVDQILDMIYGASAGDKPQVTLVPCHDGGIMGAGILAGNV